MDVLTKEQRSFNMSRIRGKDTAPEMMIRRLVHAMGFRYRLHDATVPGKPDLVFKSRRKAIFIHGCYWHRHDCPSGQVVPSTNTEFWVRKFERNVNRDLEVRRRLEGAGWQLLVIWECETRPENMESVLRNIRGFLQS